MKICSVKFQLIKSLIRVKINRLLLQIISLRILLLTKINANYFIINYNLFIKFKYFLYIKLIYILIKYSIF